MRLPRLGSSALVAAGIGLSRVAGLLREIVIAGFLGSGPAIEAFTAAFRIPNMMQNLLGEGVLSASFIPSYSKLLAEGREKEAGQLASTILLALILITTVLDWVGITFAGPLTDLVAGGYTGERRELTVTLVRITTPGIGLLVLSSWCLGVLNSHRKFFLSYVAPVIWNFVQIFMVVGFGWTIYAGASGGLDQTSVELVKVLGWATVIGAAAQLIVQLPGVIKVERNFVLAMRWDTHARHVVQKFLPVVGARGVIQISAWVDVWLASFLAVGAVGTMRYASFLFLLPISLFGMSIAAAELPEMSTVRAEAVSQRLRPAFGRIAFFVVPIATAYLFCGDYITGLLLERGEFTSSNSTMVWLVLSVMSLGLLASTLSRLMQSALYSLNDTTVPARASITRVIVSALVGGVSMFQFDQFGLTAHGIVMLGQLPALGPLETTLRETPDIARIGAVGLGLGVAVGSWTEFAMLYRKVRATTGPLHLYNTLSAVFTGAMGAGASAVIIRYLSGNWPNWLLAILSLAVAGLIYLWVTWKSGYGLVDALDGRLADRSNNLRTFPDRLE
ncbi:murein biosynthesis integral membrane protein MurJ [Stomatohabitans albus]|uniref:murein biosynthesis integral membrane protein MurJ n=1 Tax=Stomatohabitans albus TaxID=3110766 RepID=UPI00300CC4AA